MPPRKIYTTPDHTFFRHSKPVLLVIALLVLSTLFFGGSLLRIAKVPLHAAAPSPEVDARIKNLLSVSVFKDVSPEDPNAYAIAYLKNLGLVEGYDGNFKPHKTLDRAEFMVFLVKAMRIYPYAVRYNYCFDDVKNEWFAPATCFAKDRGWVEGDEGNLFHPAQDVTGAMALKVVLSAFGVEPLKEPPFGVDLPVMPEDAWYAPYVWTAASKNWLGDDSSLFDPDATMTRGDLSHLLYKVMISELPPI